MDRASEPAVRDRAIRVVRGATFAGVVGALGLTWVFANLAEAYFSGKPPQSSQANPPTVPVAAVPVQKPPKVIKTIVHRPYQGGGTTAPSGSGPRPPANGPGAAPPPPPPPACISTPSKPC
jgi:hypothetical protein